MPRAAFLMCRPTFFGVGYQINPWMDVRRQPDRALALCQWSALRDALQDLGANVSVCRSRRGLPDMTFTANAGLARRKVFIPSRFRYAERAGEEPVFTRWFRRQGYRIAPLAEDQRFEGAGDAIFLGGKLFAGYYFRSDIQTHADLGRILGARVLSLALVNPRFYHLDTCLSPLGRGLAVYYPDAFDRYGLRVLRENVDDLIRVSHDEAYQFGCNLIVVGKKVILPKPCHRLARALKRRGYLPTPLDFSEFIKAGGAGRCLTLRLK